jgi:pimeloyl-ACP methyl ester carboxylesterase
VTTEPSTTLRCGPEALAAAELGGITGRITMIGHSCGGLVSLVAASMAPELLAGVIAIDSVWRSYQQEQRKSSLRLRAGLRSYDTREDILRAFRLVPTQGAPDYVLSHIAEHSVRHGSSGWEWKADSKVFGLYEVAPDLLRQVSARVAVFRAEYGLLSRDEALGLHIALGGKAALAQIPAAHHHAILDEPISVVGMLRTQLACWGLLDRAVT